MEYFQVFGERPALYQWDLNRRIVVSCDCQEVHFSRGLEGEALVVETYTEDGTRYANVPNLLLQSALPLNVYAYVCGPEQYTRRAATLEVNPRSKPADYVYTETEVKTYDALEARVKALEDGPSGPSTPAARIAYVTILANAWQDQGAGLYSQVVTVDGATENSQVDLTPSVEQLAVFYNKDLTFVTENDNGTVTVYAIGQKPLNDYTIQATLTEVIR